MDVLPALLRNKNECSLCRNIGWNVIFDAYPQNILSGEVLVAVTMGKCCCSFFSRVILLLNSSSHSAEGVVLYKSDTLNSHTQKPLDDVLSCRILGTMK